MSYCPACASDYPDDWKRCPKDEAELLASRYLGKYRIDGIIGTGGMGAVYRAYNPDTRSPVAIKVMHAQVSQTEASRARFQREAAAVSALRTRHLVTIYDFGSEADGTMFLVMELLEGHNARPEIQAGVGMPMERINLIIDGALRGLGAAHKAGIVHRDLKPENIFVADTHDGEVAKVLDFGIAQVQSKEQSVLTKEGALMGTPAYMAPEQVAGNRGEIGPYTDVYSMGVILYEMLTGVGPFDDESVTAILSKVLTRDFAPLRALKPDLPPAVLDLVDCAMADHYDDRFADANAMREAWAAAYATFGNAGMAVPPYRKTRDQKAVVVTPGGGQMPDAMSPTYYPENETGDVGHAATHHSPAQGVPRPPAPSTLTPGGVAVTGTGEQPSGGGRGLLIALLLAVLAGGGAALYFLVLAPGDSGDPGAGPAPVAATDAAAAAATTDAATMAAAIDAAPAVDDRVIAIAAGSHAITGFPAADVAAFELDKTEVTAGAFNRAMAEAGRDARVDGPDDLPARNVSWADADAACRAVGKRLPTEAEWSMAAANAELDPAGARLKKRGVDGPAPVGSHPGDCTADGLCDMVGNVTEWTADPWVSSPGAAPDDALRAIRGGSFNVAPSSRYADTATRSKVAATTRDPELGFRCARTPETD